MNIFFYNDYLRGIGGLFMEINFFLIEFFWFCFIMKIIYIYKNLNDVEIDKVENESFYRR